MNKKISTSTAILSIILLMALLGGYFYFWKVWWPVKQAKIAQGLASFEFPYRDYSQAELNRMYPQIRNAAVPTRVTPEETYAKFREALRTNNLELALEQLYKEAGKRYREHAAILEKAHKEGKFKETYGFYPEKIEKQSMYDALASYYYIEKKDEHSLRQTIEFTKNADGDWKMDSL